jgi:hypothetical protein
MILGRYRKQQGDSPDKATAQLNANVSKLEQSSTRLAAVSAKNPPDTKSWLRMMHLSVSMLAQIR